MQQISTNVYKIGNMVSYYLVKGENGLALIDTGFGKGIVAPLTKHLNSIGHDLNDIKHILLTHAHMDHVGGLSTLQTAINTPALCHQADKAIAEGKQKALRPKRDDVSFIAGMMGMMMPNQLNPTATINDTIGEGDTLDDYGIEVLHLPGHSDGHLGFLVKADRVLIGGDVLMNFFDRIIQPMAAATNAPQTARTSIRRIADMDIQTLCLGHGPAITTYQRVRDFTTNLSTA